MKLNVEINDLSEFGKLMLVKIDSFTSKMLVGLG